MRIHHAPTPLPAVRMIGEAPTLTATSEPTVPARSARNASDAGVPSPEATYQVQVSLPGVKG